MKTKIIIFVTVVFPQLVFGANAVKDDPDLLKQIMGNTLLFIGGLIAIVAVFIIARLLRIMMDDKLHDIYVERGIDLAEAPVAATKKSFWANMMDRLTGTVPIEQEEDLMLDHNYDGIRELDNSLPPWWVAMFYITIAMGIVYISYYHIWHVGPNQLGEYKLEMEQAENAKAAFLARQTEQVNEFNVTALTDEKSLEIGKKIFTDFCLVCHGAFGEGGVGPNMTDNYFIHGPDIKSTFKVIKNGVPEKGMIAWETQMTAKDMHLVSSYIMTLVGTDPPNPKEPQGDLYEAEGGSEKTDSTANQPIGMQ